MFKKKLLTLAALAFCAAIVTAETKPESLVKNATAGLIEDDAIDSLPFGNEDGKGIVFGKYATNDGKVELGWGNAFGDALWLSIYDGIWIYGDEESTDSVTKAYGFSYDNSSTTDVEDGVNVDYVDERPRKLLSATGNQFRLYNNLAVGVGINNKIGVQAAWNADWTERKNVASSLTAGQKLGAANATIKNDTTDSSTGVTTSEKFDKIKNFARNNTIAFNFKGIGIEDDGEVPFYANLKQVRADLNFDTKSNNYSKTTDYLGATYQSITADGINQTVTIKPGVNAVVGFNFADWGVVKPSLSFEEDFEIGFDIVKNKTNYSTVTEVKTTRTTVDTTYEYTPGKKLSWTNVLTPTFAFDFNLLDQLTLKAGVGAGITLSQNNKAAGKSKVVQTTTTYTRSTGLSTVETVTTDDAEDSNKNSKEFTTSVAPKIKLGLVYAVIPEKTNINFGVVVNPGAYTWKTTEKTNANINRVVTTENKDEQGVTRSSTAVTVQPTTNNEETLKKEFDAGSTSATLHIGATWFFTEDVKFDVYYSNAFGSLFGSSNTFGAEFSVKF